MHASITLRNIYIIIHRARIKIKDIFQTFDFFYTKILVAQRIEKTPLEIEERLMRKAIPILTKNVLRFARSFFAKRASFFVCHR